MKNLRSYRPSERLEIVQMEVGGMENFSYLVGCTETRQAAIVDPAWEVDAILTQARENGWTIALALLTHHHFDHVNGVARLVEACDPKVVMQAAELPLLGHPLPNLLAVEPGQEIAIGQVPVRCIRTPGHTPGSQCFLADGTLLSGDTLFIRACGRCDLRGSDPEAMYRSLNDVLGKLPRSTLLLPGHNYAPAPVSSLGEEQEQNPYYQARGLEAFLELRMRGRKISLPPT